MQSLYEGGRILSALRVARLTKERSMLDYQTAVANTVVEVQVAYYDVLLALQQITVQEASVELLTRELADTTRRYNAGTVPRFNVLRAEVELANARPRLIRARNSYRIAKNNLVNQLGFNVPKEALEDIPLTLAGKLEAEPYKIDLPQRDRPGPGTAHGAGLAAQDPGPAQGGHRQRQSALQAQPPGLWRL